MTEGPTLTHIPHIRFTVTDLSSVTFKSLSIHEVPEFYWSDDNGQSWNFHRGVISWIIPKAGDYLISFHGTHLTPEFGSGLSEFAREFQNVEFTEDYHPENTSFSNMFNECSSLTSIDLGHLSQWVNTSAVTDMSGMFRSANWDGTNTYQTGDIVVNDGLVYVARTHDVLSEPGTYGNDWSLIEAPDTSNTTNTIIEEPIPIPIEIKESMAGITRDTNDIPE